LSVRFIQEKSHKEFGDVDRYGTQTGCLPTSRLKAQKGTAVRRSLSLSIVCREIREKVSQKPLKVFAVEADVVSREDSFSFRTHTGGRHQAASSVSW
jgi:hypothetical protein